MSVTILVSTDYQQSQHPHTQFQDNQFQGSNFPTGPTPSASYPYHPTETSTHPNQPQPYPLPVGAPANDPTLQDVDYPNVTSNDITDDVSTRPVEDVNPGYNQYKAWY